jgi:hypothetical protein
MVTGNILLMLRKKLPALYILFLAAGAFAQTSHESPNKRIRALVVSVGAKGDEARESRLDIRLSSGALLYSKSFGHLTTTTASALFMRNGPLTDDSLFSIPVALGGINPGMCRRMSTTLRLTSYVASIHSSAQ